MLVNVLEKADLTTALEGAGTFTIFGPHNDAFKKIPNVQSKALLSNVEKLKKVLLRHVVNGTKLTDSMFTDTAVEHATMNLDKIKIWKKNENKMIEWNKVTAEEDGETDIDATNGIIHIISSVLTDMSDL